MVYPGHQWNLALEESMYVVANGTAVDPVLLVKVQKEQQQDEELADLMH